MTRVVIVPPKRSNGQVPVNFPFGDQLEFGESISGQVVTAVVFSGIDPNPENILFGSPTMANNTVQQVITGGLPGVIYQLVAMATTSNANMYSKGARIAIVNAPESFNAGM